MSSGSIFIQFSIINDYIEKVQAADSLDTLLKLFQAQIEQLGFNQFTYWIMWPTEAPRKPLYISSFRKDYSQFYTEHDLKNQDPVWHRTAKQITPFSWSDVLETVKKDESHQFVFNNARDFAIKSGATIPLYGPGRMRAAVSVTCDIEQTDFDQQFKLYQGYLQVISSYLHERAIQIVTIEDHVVAPVLTKREREVILWSARGKTNWEIGEILGIAENTVRIHIQKICDKYKVSNKTHAVASAIVKGDITL